jgi:hypothetical protein
VKVEKPGIFLNKKRHKINVQKNNFSFFFFVLEKKKYFNGRKRGSFGMPRMPNNRFSLSLSLSFSRPKKKVGWRKAGPDIR